MILCRHRSEQLQHLMPMGSSVNSRLQFLYGQTSLDCHFALRRRPRALAGLHDDAFLASGEKLAERFAGNSFSERRSRA